MNKFEEANSVNTFVDPYDRSNPQKINTTYYNLRGIPKNVSIGKQKDFADIAVRHNKVPLVDFQDQKSQSQFHTDIYHKSDFNQNNLNDSNMSTNKQHFNLASDQFNQGFVQQQISQYQQEQNQINQSQSLLSEQVRSLSRDKDQLQQQVNQLQRQLLVTEKKISLLLNSNNKNDFGKLEELNAYKKELQQKQNQLQQRQKSREDVYDKKLSLLADQIGNLEKNLNQNCINCSKKDVTIRCLEHHYDPYKYTRTHKCQQEENYFDIPEYQYTNYKFQPSSAHYITKQSCTQPSTHYSTRYSYVQPEETFIEQSVDYSPVKYKYSYTDTSTRYQSPCNNSYISDRFDQGNRVIKQVKYSSPSYFKSNCQLQNQNFKKIEANKNQGRQCSSRGLLLGETTVNTKVTCIQDRNDKISYRKLTPEIYEQENPEFAQVLKTSRLQNPTLIINKGQQKQSSTYQPQQQINQSNSYLKQNDVRIVKRTRSRSPVSRFIK